MSSNNKEMRKEYDFSKGVRGKHFEKMREGHQTIVYKSEGGKSVSVTRPIILEPEVQKYFPNSEAVNKVLRNLIDLVPERQE